MKQFEKARQGLDQANSKVLKSSTNTKLTEVKLVEIEQEKEAREKNYLSQGDVTFKHLQETIEEAKIRNLVLLIDQFENYHQFFLDGYNMLAKERDKILEIKAKVEEQRKRASINNNNNESDSSAWCPPGLFSPLITSDATTISDVVLSLMQVQATNYLSLEYSKYHSRILLMDR